MKININNVMLNFSSDNLNKIMSWAPRDFQEFPGKNSSVLGEEPTAQGRQRGMVQKGRYPKLY
jgi:hypothetical protein